MRKNNCFYYYIAILLAIGFTSCNRENLEPARIESSSTLGKKLENPYTMEVMEQAWKNIQPDLLAGGRISSSNELKLTPTHVYLKFKPRNEEELDILNADSTLELYGYPLDYEVFEGINNYRDPEVAEGQPTYQYAAVPIGHKLPNIIYEKLADVFMPEDAPEFASVRISLPCIPVMLTNEAMTITNNLEYLIPIENGCGGGGSGGGTGCSYCPQGTMRVWDDANGGNFVPITGLKVKARRFLKTKTAITNGSGKYVIRGIRGKVKYSFKWKRYNFVIRDNFLDAAETIGPKTKGWWSVNFRGGVSQFHATIFRAAHHYYYGSIKRLRRPPENGFFGNSIKIKAKNEENSSNGTHCGPCNFYGLTTEIRIFNNTTKPHYDYVDLYATTIHELAHASHWAMDELNYNKMCDGGIVFCPGDLKIAESWARGVQWELTRMVYPDYFPDYFGNYTGVVEDMIDGRNGYDEVEGYSIRQIEDALRGEKKWNEWKDNIKSKYNNATEDNLDALFNHWD